MRGYPIVISSPSGGGKTTLVHRILADMPKAAYSVSICTRPPRTGERNGRDYFFVSKPAFERMVRKHELAEWANVHGYLYGTPKKFLDAKISLGYFPILDIDVQGAIQLKKKYPDGVYIFLIPPTLRELSRRLRERHTDSAEEIKKRLMAAKREISMAQQYDYVVLNDDIDAAVERVKTILEAERWRAHRAESRLKALR
ncbi:MAG: guanylate kinase [Candidatus Lindowbacteria bacterium RIFCSPLOWO2_12_FULL_62_27]|nr:MAG: guanylate kinase [Candidatus Lindowbacteria bacterium RIFCSPLOWO2_12_FULL_62_27]OGH63903.1 MAG: guanylate kinase [Candidatus Lindowbacteria bacterium RIFCSPLOWO2_02_FULL_62_12]